MRSSEHHLLACPRCGGALPRLRCASCGVQYEAPGGIPDLRLPADPRTEAVREFYARAPFPGYPPHDSLQTLRARAEGSDFARQLDAAIPGDATVLEMGCGTGQLSLFLASADRNVVGADLSRRSLELGAAAADRYGLRKVEFVETDLRRPGLRAGAFDVVVCSGVLHHTPEPRVSFAAVARLVRHGGVVVIGVYNRYARWPFRVRRAISRLTGYRWTPVDPVLRGRQAEPERRDAWWRDQYRHVEEHSHTLREVQRWFQENGVEYVRAVPSALLATEEPDLFAQSPDNWALEGWIAQLSWARTSGREGGLFIVVGSVDGGACSR
jgi:SAM-dependent methyltransferase